MTPKERVLAAINHQQPDRVPIQTYLTPEIEAQLAGHLGSADILAALGVDFRGVGPRFTGVERPVPEGCASVDEWGTGYIMKEYPGGTYPEPFHQPLAHLASLDDVNAYPCPG